MNAIENENFTLESQLLEVASHTNYKEATFLISVLGEPDGYNRIIPEDVGEKYADTLIGYPIVAKLKKNIFGQPSDFGGHELYEIKAKNGKKVKRFGTIPIGSVLNVWVEERELDGYDNPKKCILCKTKLWSSRFPEYFKVLDKLWKDGHVSSSWELSALKSEKKDGFTIFKAIEFLGTCILGSTRTPAVPEGGILEYAELDDSETQLAEALEKDLADLKLDGNEKEEIDLAEKTKKDQSVEDTEEKNTSNVDETEKEHKKDTAECGTKKKKKTTTAEIDPEEPDVAENSSEPENESEDETQTASLTQNDLLQRISRACRKSVNCNWGYVSYWFPEEKTVWFIADNRESELDFKLFTYEVDNDEVTVSEPQDVKLTVSVTEVNSVIAEKDKKIGDLTAELEIKENAIIKAGETMNKLKVEISELKPYKEAADKAEQARVEAEIAEVKETLKNNMLKNNLFTEEEVASAEIAELIESRNETAIKSLIADRYIANLEKAELEEIDANNNIDNTATASLDLDDDDANENPVSYMAKILKKY